jgi:site-specific DNA-methyltransferase (cytosine-N4-specific)
MNSQTSIVEDSNTFSPDSIEFDLDNIRDKNYLTHNFHSYPAKFIPQFPRKIIGSLSTKNEIIFDPFCGSGTTLVEAKLLGRNSIGVDINPIATLVSKVKTTKLSDNQLKEIKRIISEIGVSINLAYGTRPISPEKSDCVEFKLPNFLNRDHWFKPLVLNELAIIKAHIDTITDRDSKDFLLVAFSSIITRVSNQESDTRYARQDKKIKEFDTYNVFRKKADDMLGRIVEFSRQSSDAFVRIYNQDSSELPFLNNETVDLIVTSPPYLNSYDYYLYHKLRMYWLGMDHYRVQELEIGSRHKHSDNDLGVDDYLMSINKCLQEACRVLRKGRYLGIVIGDAIKDNKCFRMNSLFENIAKGLALALRKEIVYPLRKYTRAFTPGQKTALKNGYIMIFQKD